jgi:hypothetical protein
MGSNLISHIIQCNCYYSVDSIQDPCTMHLLINVGGESDSCLLLQYTVDTVNIVQSQVTSVVEQLIPWDCHIEKKVNPICDRAEKLNLA